MSRYWVWSVVRVRLTSSGLKWQSDTERREHWGEASGGRRRITEKYFTMIIAQATLHLMIIFYQYIFS